MFKRAFLLLLTLAALGIWPVAAQQVGTSSVEFVPADFAGFVQLRMDAPTETLQDLNIGAFIAARLQPLRVRLSNAALDYDTFIPTAQLFDVEGTTFAGTIAPWIGNDLVIAYREFDGQLRADAADTLLILSTNDVFSSASQLSNILEGQDLLGQAEYRGIPIHLGDKTSIALTEAAVFVGPTDLIQAALDVQAGISDSMINLPVQALLRGEFEQSPSIYAFVNKDYVLPAVSGLLGGHANTESLLAAFGGALSQLRGDQSFESLLLTGGIDGIAAGLDVAVNVEDIFVEGRAVFHAAFAPLVDSDTAVESHLTDMIPQNALLVGNGSDAQGMIYNVITALPLSNFAREIVGGLSIQTVGTLSEQITVPDASQVERAVQGYLALMEQFHDFNIQSDLLDYLGGDYALALLPRPNNPVPVLNVPFDFLIVAQVNDSDAALSGATTLIQTMLNLEPLETTTVDDLELHQVGLGRQPVVSLGVSDGVLLIGTGDSIPKALDAGRGDNRITKQVPWQRLSENEPPGLYLDSFVFLNTFFPSPGGPVSSVNNRVHYAFNGHYLGSGIYELILTATLPTG